MLPTKKIISPHFYCFYLMAIFILLSTCRRGDGTATIILNKTTHNSYFNSDEHDLADNETIVFYEGLSKVSVIAADLELADLRFRITLIDANQDGLFNTTDLDMLVLSPYEQNSVAIDLTRVCVGRLKKNNYIKVNRTWFLLLEINNAGDKIKLVQLENPPSKEAVATYCTRWKPIDVINVKGEETYLKRTQNVSKKELILVSRMPPLGDPLLQLLDDNKEKWEKKYDLTILYMGGYDKTKTNALENTISFKYPAFFTVVSSCEVINCHATPPFAFLIGKDGTILKENFKEEEIIRILDI